MSNRLGKPNPGSVPQLQKLCYIEPVVKSNSRPLPNQAMALKTFEMVEYGLERIHEKCSQMYNLKILLQVLHVLVTSLKPRQLGYALQDLGLFNVDTLFQVLFQESRLRLGLDRSSLDDVIVAIRTVLKEKDGELTPHVNFVSKFLILYSSGKLIDLIEVLVNAMHYGRLGYARDFNKLDIPTTTTTV